MASHEEIMPKKSGINKKTVLFVDDEPEILNIAGKIMKARFNLLKASNGSEAWEVLKDWKVDCVITDIDMPIMDGVELLKKMRMNGNNVNVIVVTGNYNEQLRQTCEELDVKAFFQKPYLVRDLIEKINALL